MSKQSVGFRVQEETKSYIYDLTGSLSVPLGKFLDDLCEQMKNGDITYDGTKFKAKCDCKSVNTKKSAEISPLNADELDLTELLEIANDRRVTPQSILNNALRPYRRKNFDVDV